MSEIEMNSYRFISGQDPTDEMLNQIMKEVAEEAEARQKKATAQFFSDMRRNAESKKAKWASRINRVVNG